MRTLAAFLFSSLFSPVIFAGIELKDLTKISPETDVHCVEFYSYQGGLYCSNKPLNDPGSDMPEFIKERQNILFDSRPWRMAWTKKTPQIITIEYVPEKDDIKNWSELITSQYIPGIEERLSVIQFVHLSIKSLHDTGLKPETAILYKSPDTVIFEFRITSPIHLQQHELQKVHRGKDGFYILHYAIKKEQMTDHNKKKWLEKLKQSRPFSSQDDI